MISRQLLIYVQALPISVPTSARQFLDLESSEYRMSQSSKAALAFASTLGFHEIVAVGFSPVLREALARGATSCKSVPLCDDPLEQSSFFPKEHFSHILIGENPDWVFTGSSLAGVLSESRKMQFCFFKDGDSIDFPERSVILVKDSGESPSTIDIRRIKSSFEASVNPEGLLGNSTLSKREVKRGETVSGDASEISTILARRIKRMTGV
ncbi:MAG: hypothetical protein ABSE82_10720 [Nitrososphaerales archaeon]